MAKRKKIMAYPRGGSITKAGFGAVLQGVSPLLNAIPVFGGAASTIANIAGTVIGAGEQAKATALEQKELERARLFRNRGIKTQNDAAFLDTFPEQGLEGASFQGARGGRIPTTTSLNDPIDGIDPTMSNLSPIGIQGGNAEQLSSDSVQFHGNTHGEGGINITDNLEVEDVEVLSGNRVYSDRIKVPKETAEFINSTGLSIPKGSTYATASAKLGRLKGRFEEKSEDINPAAANTGRIMVQKIDDAMTRLFDTQERNKGGSTTQMFAKGGRIRTDPKPKAKSRFTEGSIGDKNPFFIDALNELFFDAKRKQLISERDTYGGKPGIVGEGLDRISFIMDPSTGLNRFGETREQVNRRFPVAGPITPTPLVNQPQEQPQGQPFIGTPQMAPVVDQTGFGYGGKTKRLQNGGDLTNNLDFIKQPGGNSNFGAGANRFFNRYSGDLLNAASTFANEKLIGSLDTTLEPNLVPLPRDNYVDRSGLAKNENAIAAQTARQGLKNVGIRRGGAEANIFAEEIKNNSRINQGENLRRDRFDTRLRGEQNRVNAVNSNILNRNDLLNFQAGNEQTALRQANITNFTQGLIGNQTSRDVLDQSGKALALRAFQSGDRGTLERMRKELGFQDMQTFLQYLEN